LRSIGEEAREINVPKAEGDSSQNSPRTAKVNFEKAISKTLLKEKQIPSAIF